MSLRPIPSTTATHGPFRRVVEVVDVPASTSRQWYPGGDVVHRFPARRQEVLECGHRGRVLHERPWGWDEPRKRRRCLACLPAWEAEQDAIAAQDAAVRARHADDARQVEIARRASLTPAQRAQEDIEREQADTEAAGRRAAIRAANTRRPR